MCADSPRSVGCRTCVTVSASTSRSGSLARLVERIRNAARLTYRDCQMQDDTIQRALESYVQNQSDFADSVDDEPSAGTFVEWPPKPPPPASLGSVVHSNARIELPDVRHSNENIRVDEEVESIVVIEADDVDDSF